MLIMKISMQLGLGRRLKSKHKTTGIIINKEFMMIMLNRKKFMKH